MLALSKNKGIEVPKDNPFEFDALDRKRDIENLTSIISAINEPFVLSLNGQWGSGKTTFIKLWRQYLENDGYITLTYNAWDNDSSKEPLISLIAEIQEQIEEKYKEADLINLLNSLKKISGKVLEKTLPAAIKLGTYGLLNIKTDSNMEQVIADYFSELPSEYLKYKNEREKFKTSLSKFVDKLLSTNIIHKEKKIVFFIDELDRCRPLFAIELLEKIKHFFDVENYVFILAVDREQLGHSLKTIYGHDMDTYGYLRRFIDYNYDLPKVQIDDFITLLKINLGYKGLFLNNYLSSSRSDLFMNMLIGYCKSFNLSLRDIEQLFFKLKIIIPQIDFEILYFLYTMPLLLVLSIKHPQIYDNFISRRTDANSIIELLKTNKEVQRYFDTIPLESLKIKVPEYLKMLSAYSIDDANALSLYYFNGIKDNPNSFPVHIFSDFEKTASAAFKNRALDEIKGIIEFSSRIYK